MEARQKTSSDTKLVARHAISVFGGPPSVWRFTCEADELSLDVGGCADRPFTGAFSYTTIGLSDCCLVNTGEPAARVELAAVCRTDRPRFPNILAAAALMLIRQGIRHTPRADGEINEIKPGHAIRDVISEFYPGLAVRHLFLARPFLWGQRLNCLQGSEKCIAWLAAIPSTTDELQYLETNGADGLEQLYRQRRVDMYNLGRATWLK